jgi:cell wall-active antibiotic response 4TMS protein YvqF/B-box zinc finger protein
MNCANHPQAPSTAFCRTCGKALCEECKRDVRGVIYCEDCIVARLGDTAPAAGAATPAAAAPAASGAYAEPVPGAPNPALAAVLATFFPFGIGAVYNGQLGKAVAHLVTFAMLIVMIDNAGGGYEPLFGMSLAFFIIYQVFDAYRTAKAKQFGLPLPDPGGIYKALGVQTDATAAAIAAGGAGAPAAPRVPTAAVILIGLGFLFLLQNMGWFHFHWIGKLWPLILIFIGVRMFMRSRPSGS